MANDKVLPEGIRMFAPHQNAPDFVKGSVVITLNDLVEFGKKNPNYLTEYQGKKQLKLQLLESRDGKPYLAVDTYKPGQNTGGGSARNQQNDDINSGTNDDLPF